MENTVVNKVSDSALITLDLEELYPKESEVMVFDLKDYLFMGLILKEKDFREALKALDVTPFTGKYVAVTCSADAIIPMWAYMLVATYLQPVARNIFHGNIDDAKNQILLNNIAQLNLQEYNDKRVVIKGCGDAPISESAYLTATKLLRPITKSIMYGEPCSTVPIFKKKV